MRNQTCLRGGLQNVGIQGHYHEPPSSPGGLVAPMCLQLPSGAFVSRPLHSQSSDLRPVRASPLPLASTGVCFSGCFCPHCGVGHP